MKIFILLEAQTEKDSQVLSHLKVQEDVDLMVGRNIRTKIDLIKSILSDPPRKVSSLHYYGEMK